MSQKRLAPDNIKAVPYAFSQQNGYPLNANEVFDKLSSDDPNERTAESFAASDGSYDGQIIAVVTGSEDGERTVKHYSIENSRLVEFGSGGSGDSGGSSDLIKYGEQKTHVSQVTTVANSVKIWTDTIGILHIDIS